MGHRFFRFAIVSLGIASVAVAAAGEPQWLKMHDTDQGDLYVDTNSVRVQPGARGQVVGVWLRVDSKVPDAQGRYKSVLWQQVFNCQDGTGGVKQSTSFAGPNGSGGVLSTEANARPEMLEVRPASVEYDILALACTNKAKRPAAKPRG